MKTIGVNDVISIEAKIHGIVHKLDIKKNQYKPLSYKRQLYVILIYIQAKGVAVRKTFTEFC